jgi:RNA polymerase sigma-70 factor (ECF subfamily)
MLSWDHGPARSPGDDIGEPVPGPIWLEPWVEELPSSDPDQGDPAAAYAARENIELAYVAALQHLPANQRAVLILREVLAFPAAEVAEALDTSVPSVNSALQRARKSVAERVPGRNQPVGDASERAMIDAFVAAWERADIDALVDLLSEDVRFTMPPLPAWYDGRADVAGFIGRNVFATPWRLVPATAIAQPAFACYQWDGTTFALGAVNVLSIRAGQISWIAAFLDPGLFARTGLPPRL